jgi:hypothetical protein
MVARMVLNPPSPNGMVSAASTPVSAGARTVVKKCPNAVQLCVSVTTATTASATSIWATTNAARPWVWLARRWTKSSVCFSSGA